MRSLLSARLKPLLPRLLVLRALAIPAAAQSNCSTDGNEGPYTITPGAPQIKVRTLTVTVFNTRGQVIAVYTFTNLQNLPGGSGYDTVLQPVQIKLNNQPYTTDSEDNPLGIYSWGQAQTLEQQLCPNSFGSFPLAIFHPASPRATALTIPPLFGQTASTNVSADFNNDGIPDNATATGLVQITLYTQTGAGASKIISIGGATSTAIVAGDFNGDGNIDLAVSVINSSGPGRVAVLLGKGDGTFTGPVNFPAGPQPLSLAAADINGDGKLDLVVASDDETVFPPVGTIDVLLGKGDGTFAAPVIYNAGEVPQSLIAVDLNGDGRPDIAVLDANTSTHDQLLVFLSNSDGTLRALPPIAAGTYLGQLSYTDLNHDGKLDLAIADRRSSDMTVMMGNGDGTFQAPKAYVSTPQPVSIGLVPLDDSTTLALASDAIDGSVLATPIGADGTVYSSLIQNLGVNLTAAAAADVNHDGKLDIMVTDQGANKVYAILNSGSYQFASPVAYSLNATPSATAIADVNGDGNPDLIVADTNGLDVLLGKGNGTFGAPQTTAVSGASAGVVGPAIADFNGDGKPDAVIAVGGQLSVLAGQGNGGFSAAVAITSVSGTVNPVALVTGDFNGDGKPDLAFAYGLTTGSAYSGFLAIALGNGNGTFQTSTISLPAGPLSIAVGDINKDGKLDVIVGVLEPTGPCLVMFLGKGDGTFQNPATLATSAGLPSINVVDYNRDGNPDLVLGDCCGLTEASILYGKGDGTFQPELQFQSGPNPTYLAIADFDGDGKPDIVIAGKNLTNGTLVLVRNTTPTVAQAAVVSAANPAATAIAPVSLAVAYGADLANSQPSATSLPLPTIFGGTTVSILDAKGVVTAAPLVYVSAGQVDFLVASTVAEGAATVAVKSGDGTESAAQVSIAPVAPGVFTLNPSNLAAAIAVRVSASGTQTVEQVYTVNVSGAVVAAPVNLGAPTDQVVLEIFGTGIRAAGTGGVTVTIGGVSVPVQYAGMQGSYDGLDQVNVTLPQSLAGKGSVTIQLTANGIAANATNVTIQ